MERAISTITILPLTKEERQNYIKKVVDEFNNIPENEQSKLFAQMKIAIETLEAIMKHQDVRSAIIDRMENKRVENSFAEISLSSRKNFDFSQDIRWHELNVKFEKAKMGLKAHEGILKVLKKEVANVETGEIMTPPSYSETEILTIKLK
jgi:hypothetical protein